MRSIYTSLLIATLAIPLQAEEHWGHWRGPEVNGVARKATPPLTWSETENLAWKAPIKGEGSSTPIVWGNQVFILSAARTDRPGDASEPKTMEGKAGQIFGITTPTRIWQFLVTSYDRNTGQVLWEQVAAEAIPNEGRHPDNNFASGSPTTDGKRLYLSFGTQGVFAYDLQGKALWKQNLGIMETRLSFGSACTPVIHGDTLLVLMDQEGDSFLYALDAATGEVRWKTPRNEGSNWNTPLVVKHGGVTQVVANGGYRSMGYDFTNGKELWSCGGQTLNCIASPVTTDGLVFCMSGFRGSMLTAIPLDARGDLTNTDRITWKHERDTPYVPSPLLYDGILYFIKVNQNIISGLDPKTGKPIVSPTRIKGLKSIYASPVGAARRLYITGRDGTTTVLSHGPDPKVLAVNPLDDKVDASLALAGSQIFIRGSRSLYCIAEK